MFETLLSNAHFSYISKTLYVLETHIWVALVAIWNIVPKESSVTGKEHVQKHHREVTVIAILLPPSISYNCSSQSPHNTFLRLHVVCQIVKSYSVMTIKVDHFVFVSQQWSYFI